MQILKEFKFHKVYVFSILAANSTRTSGGLTHVKEIPNTKLLVSLNHNYLKSANMAIFDLSWQVPKKIYSFEGVSGGNY